METRFSTATAQHGRVEHRAPVTSPPPAEHGHEEAIDLNVPKPRALWVVAAAIVGMAALAALLVTGLLPRRHQAGELQADSVEAELLDPQDFAVAVAS